MLLCLLARSDELLKSNNPFRYWKINKQLQQRSKELLQISIVLQSIGQLAAIAALKRLVVSQGLRNKISLDPK